MRLENWWERTLLEKKPKFCALLQEDISCSFLVLGGGVAGLHAALSLVEAGKEIVLLEKSICGGSSSGRSSGFLTPDSELEVYQMLRRYGISGAKKVWSIPVQGVEIIRSTAEKYKISCDLEKQDSFFVGIRKQGEEAVRKEAKAHLDLGLPYTSYSQESIGQALGTSSYTAGLRTTDTFAINMMLYCYGLKQVLLKKGVRIFENSEVLSLDSTTAHTKKGKVTGKSIIVCIDKMKEKVSPLARKSYHAQTFLAMSTVLSDEQVHKLFPDGKCMVWDSQLIYSYFRLTKDNRLLVGGGSVLTTYDPWYFESSIIIEKVIRDLKKNFPFLEHLTFEYYWPGQIDITKDIMPIVDYDPEDKNKIFVLGNPGLPWAAFSGGYAAALALGKKDVWKNYLGMDRKFFIPDEVQFFLGKIPSFAINNVYSKYYQVDER
ncbi:MAG: FAD dependent oxidoreductase [archaeon GW2011_AR17]|nr:MAG: FAD dependent oxidoreductase [archaeon GW2011_AR17]MBS3153694.1 FAD-binding oxidoreductase [Candidatus Woesearchaeota archaeon]HIH15370.1 FAD-binding oxidoreductase [Nanoarchaeota archaeon]HIH58831.1 FAD-binding oxidoreductase [Nanoarchaeota archaeon]HII14252.1 FAD-binding oxidoreductase [Nanoarchaeota archaeon]